MNWKHGLDDGAKGREDVADLERDIGETLTRVYNGHVHQRGL
jgi:hypothetical protein